MILKKKRSALILLKCDLGYLKAKHFRIFSRLNVLPEKDRNALTNPSWSAALQDQQKDKLLQISSHLP